MTGGLRRWAVALLSVLVLWGTSDGLLRSVHERTAHGCEHAVEVAGLARSTSRSLAPAHLSHAGCPTCQALAFGATILTTPATVDSPHTLVSHVPPAFSTPLPTSHRSIAQARAPP